MRLLLILTALLMIDNWSTAQTKDQYLILDKVIQSDSDLKRKSLDLKISTYKEFVSQIMTEKYLISTPQISDTSRLLESLIPDSLYFIEQFKHHVNWDHNKTIIQSINVRRGLDIWISIRHFFDKEFFLKRTYYKVSRPFFINRQNNAALIYIESYNGPVSGSGGYYMMIKVGQNWTILGYDPTYIN